MFTKVIKVVLALIGAFLVFNGLINISDNGMISAYDITSILSGLGFILITISLRRV